MKRSILFRFTFFTILILLFGSITIFIELTQLKKLSKEYKIVNTDLSINGTLENIKKRKGIAYVIINNTKLVFRPSANQNYRKEYLIDNIVINDSIAKMAGNDTIRVYRNQRVLTFIHDKMIQSSDHNDK